MSNVSYLDMVRNNKELLWDKGYLHGKESYSLDKNNCNEYTQELIEQIDLKGYDRIILYGISVIDYYYNNDMSPMYIDHNKDNFIEFYDQENYIVYTNEPPSEISIAMHSTRIRVERMRDMHTKAISEWDEETLDYYINHPEIEFYNFKPDPHLLQPLVIYEGIRMEDIYAIFYWVLSFIQKCFVRERRTSQIQGGSMHISGRPGILTHKRKIIG